jgi:hypothetical protein
MEELVKLKRLRIKKDLLLVTIQEKKETKTKSQVYLLIFFGLFVTAGILLASGGTPTTPDQGSASAGTFAKFLAGKFLIVGVILLFRTLRLIKEIQKLEDEYKEMKKEVRYLSN